MSQSVRRDPRLAPQRAALAQHDQIAWKIAYRLRARRTGDRQWVYVRQVLCAGVRTHAAGCQQFTPMQLLRRRPSGGGGRQVRLCPQLYRHLTEYYAFTSEAAEARHGLGRIGHKRADVGGKRCRSAIGGQLAGRIRRLERCRTEPSCPAGALLPYRTRVGDGCKLPGLADCRRWGADGARAADGRAAIATARLPVRRGVGFSGGRGRIRGFGCGRVAGSFLGPGRRARCSIRPMRARELVALERSRQSGH